MTEETPVYTLLVEVGRAEGDGLPGACDGAAIVCFVAAASEEEAVRATVETLRDGGLAPLSVDSYGTEAERVAAGQEIGEDDRDLMRRARDENAVVVSQMVPFSDDEEGPEDESGAEPAPKEG